jgi:ATP-dependent Clp protease ATP-binding subunit ClpA
LSQPSPGLAMAWRIAASEAGAAGYQKIECAHLMMGLLSLDKANPKALKDLGFEAARMGQVAAEEAAINELFEGAQLTAPALRRDLRSRVKRKPARPKGVMSRSPALKTAFARAELLAGQSEMNSLHLLTVLLKAPDPAIVSLLLEHHLGPDIASRAEAAAMLPCERMGGPVTRTRTAESRGASATAPPGDVTRLLKLEAHLKSKIIGQDEAMTQVAARVRLAHSGIAERRKLLAVFLFLGPSGVGKTETALALGKFLSPDEPACFDMSDYTDAASASRLATALAEAIRAHPYSVISFDAVEKAHAKVFDLFLALFDTGLLEDANGNAVDARNIIAVLSTSMGAGQAAAKAGLGAKSTETVPVTRTGRMKADLRRFFRPEFLSKVDEVVTFKPLEEADIRRIARPVLAALITKVRKTNGVLLKIEPDAENFVIRSGSDPEKGVRALRPAIERLIEVPLATLAKAGKLAQHPAWRAVQDEGGVYFLPD